MYFNTIKKIVLEKTGYPYKWNWYLHHTKNRFKMDQRYKSKTPNYKISRWNHRRKYSWPWVKQKFLTPKSWYIKEKNDKLDFVKIINVCSPRNTVKRIERRLGQKCANHIHSKGIVLNINKELLKINRLEKNEPNKKFLGKR